MIDYKLLKKCGITPKTIKKINSSYYVETANEKYILKKCERLLDKQFDYLLSRNYNYFPKVKTVNDYNIYEYIDNVCVSDEEKLLEIVELIGLLHTKTTRYIKVDIDDYKKEYESLKNHIDSLMMYYLELNNVIDEEIYMSPSHYLLALNISKVYSAISFCNVELENWYDLVKDNTKRRFSYIHNNIDLDHFVRGEDVPYLISWDKSKVDLPIYDLVLLYKKYYDVMDFEILFNNYQKRYPLKEDEIKLFFIKISLLDKIEFSDDEFNNVKLVKKMLEFLDRGDQLIRPYYEKVVS